jgi:alpha-1,2-mannosyltransferase
VRYWTADVLQVGRVGNLAYSVNQSLAAVLARAGLSPQHPAGLAAWLALSAIVLVVTGLGMRRALAAGEPGLALCLNALAGLLISPISWTHHWVWCVPAILALASLARRSPARPRGARLPLAVAATGLVVFAASPQRWFPHAQDRELHLALWQQAADSSYVLFAALVLALAAVGLLTLEARRQPPARLADPGLDQRKPAAAVSISTPARA